MNKKLAFLAVVCCGVCATAGEFDALIRSLDRLRNNHSEAGKDIELRATPRRLALQRIDRISTPWKVKALAAEWLLRAHLLSVKSNPTGMVDNLLLERSWELAFTALEQAKGIQGKAAGGMIYRGSESMARLAGASYCF